MLHAYNLSHSDCVPVDGLVSFEMVVDNVDLGVINVHCPTLLSSVIDERILLQFDVGGEVKEKSTASYSLHIRKLIVEKSYSFAVIALDASTLLTSVFRHSQSSTELKCKRVSCIHHTRTLHGQRSSIHCHIRAHLAVLEDAICNRD